MVKSKVACIFPRRRARGLVWGAVGCAILVVAVTGVCSAQQTQAAPKKVVVMKLDGVIREAPPEVDLGLPDIRPNLFWDQLRVIRMAANDEQVKALTILINQPQLNVAQCQQLLAELKRFRTSGKRVYVHGDSLETPMYLVALGADEIAMTPEATLWLAGVSLQTFYYKGLMDKLGIGAETVHVGKFKLAAEPYTRATPSAEMTAQLEELVADVYDQLVTEVAEGRELSKDLVKTIIDEGPYLTDEAHKRGLIDRPCHRVQFLKDVRDAESAVLAYNYGRGKRPAVQSGFSGLMQLFSMLGTGRPADTRPKIAVLTVTGFITEGESDRLFGSEGVAGSTTLRRACAKIFKDRRYKAVVVRVDSPGGSATGSEIIWRSVHRLAETRPVAVSTGALAASGGYYLSCAGQRIFASPATLTGSIGVVAGKPVLNELMEKIGVVELTVSRGKNAQLLSPFATWSEHQRKTLRRQLERIYRTFVTRVKEGRSGKVKDAEALATGKVFTGRQAVELGLVDEIGTLADAVAWAAEQAKLTSYQVVFFPKPKTLPELIFESLGYRTDGEEVVGDIARLVHDRRVGPLWPLPGGAASRLMTRAHLLGQVLRGGGVLALAPYMVGVQ